MKMSFRIGISRNPAYLDCSKYGQRQCYTSAHLKWMAAHFAFLRRSLPGLRC